MSCSQVDRSLIPSYDGHVYFETYLSRATTVWLCFEYRLGDLAEPQHGNRSTPVEVLSGQAFH